MAEAFALTCLGKIGDTVLGKIGDCFVAPVQRQFTYTCCFNSNITELETQLKKLETTRQEIQLGVDENLRNVRVVGPTVEAWLTSANEVTSEVEGIIQDTAKVKEGCLNGWCPNLKLRYSLSRKAVKKTMVVIDLQKDGVQYTRSFYTPPPPCLETIPNRDFMVFNSQRLIMEDIIKALTDDNTTLIGICGLPGVGKTKMVQEVRKRVKGENLFDVVAFLAVGQYPDLTKVQNSIGDIFGLEDLRKLDDATTRASLIRQRLSQDNKRILLILDDIWAEIDLEDQGIPLGGSHGSLKILYTSRFRGVWHDVPTKKEIALGLLSEEEAWQLFREKAGDLADTPDLQPLAKQIVNKCGGLPLALIIIGGTLSRKSRERFIKDKWEDMCDRLICPSSIRADKGLSSSLELSYNFVEDEEAKRLFLLCCFFPEDQSIWIEELARFSYGLSLFDGVNEMTKVRHRVFALIDDLKSRYLLLDGDSIHYESVKVHDTVRDMGISIASRDKGALVSNGADWPMKDTYEHYTSIFVVSRTMTELPQGLTCKNLEFLMICYGTLKKLPHNFFEGMEKLKVLYLCDLNGIPTLRSSRNLRQLTLNRCDMLPSVSDFGSLLNLEILSFNGSSIKELPEEIGKLVNLRLLDLRDSDSLKRIPPGVISRLVRLEELHLIGSKFIGWEGEDKEEEGRNANLREFECLSNLHTLQIVIRNDVLIPKVPIFSKLKIYTVVLVDSDDHRYASLKGYEKQLSVISSNPIPLDGGGIDSLLKSADYLFLAREGCNDLVRELVRRGAIDGLQQLKNLEIVNCDTPKCLANTMNSVQQRNPNAPSLFPILEKMSLYGLHNLREICRGPVPAPSFGKLTQIAIKNCGKLKNLFQLAIVGCLTQLKTLTVEACDVMEEVIQKEQRGDFATIIIKFPKLECLTLAELPSLVGFCRGIDQIDFPQLKYMYLRHLGPFKCLFPNNCHLSSNSEQTNSLFPQKVSLPNLEVLDIADLENLERLGHGPVSVGSLSKLKEFSVKDCGKLLCVFASHLLPMLQDLEKLIVKCCNLLEVVFELEGVDSNETNPEILSPLKLVALHCLPKLNYISKRDPMGFKYIQTLDIIECDSLRCVFSPTMRMIIPQLHKLKIWSCEKLSRIVAEENGLGESTVNEVEFPQLETVELRSLPNLVSFFPNMNTTTLEKSTGHYHNPLQSQPLFNEKVAIPSLKYLELIRLENVSDLWYSELPTSSFSKLEKLEVSYCASLRNMFHPSMARGLVNLQELLIKGCSNLEAVVGKEEEVEGGHGRKIDKTLFPQLGELQLGSLPNLRRFCHFTHPLELPLLSEIDILFCPRMDTFSLGHVSTPNLSLPGISWNGDLNNAMQFLQKGAENHLFPGSIPRRKVLKHEGYSFSSNDLIPLVDDSEMLYLSCIKGLKNVIHNGGVGNVYLDMEYLDVPKSFLEPHKLHLLQSFNKLIVLRITLCKSKYLFSHSTSSELVHLEELTVQSCEAMEEIVRFEGPNDEDELTSEVRFSKLKRLVLQLLPNLSRFYAKKEKMGTTTGSSSAHAQPFFNEKVKLPRLENLELEGLQNMDNIWGSEYPTDSLSELKFLKAKRCVELRNIFRPSMAEVIVNLQELIINDCSKMEAVVDGEEEIEDGQGRKIYETLFPNFTKLELRRLPELRRFCHFTHPFKLPLLSQMVIEDCPRLNSFSSGGVSTPNLLSRDLSCDFVDDDTTVTEEEEPSKMA